MCNGGIDNIAAYHRFRFTLADRVLLGSCHVTDQRQEPIRAPHRREPHFVVSLPTLVAVAEGGFQRIALQASKLA